MRLTKLDKKGAFDVINKGMLTFITFILVVMLVVLLIQVVKRTDIICPANFVGDTCLDCPSEYTFTNNSLCCNSTQYTSTLITNCSLGNQTEVIPYGGSAYNATVDMQAAGNITPQFSQIIVIVIIIVGILALITAVGIGAYQKIKK